jgi:hypothetical protein
VNDRRLAAAIRKLAPMATYETLESAYYVRDKGHNLVRRCKACQKQLREHRMPTSTDPGQESDNEKQSKQQTQR